MGGFQRSFRSPIRSSGGTGEKEHDRKSVRRWIHWSAKSFGEFYGNVSKRSHRDNPTFSYFARWKTKIRKRFVRNWKLPRPIYGLFCTEPVYNF